MGVVAAVTMAVAAVVGAGAAVYSAEQASDAREKEKRRLEKQAERDVIIHEKESEKLKARQRASFAAAGVEVGTGSPLAVVEISQREAAEERAWIAKGYGWRGEALQSDADRIRFSGYSQAAGTLLAGASTYSQSPYAGQNPFATK